MSDHSRGGGFLSGALFGALLGAVGGILFAPKKGEETREDLKKKINDYSDKVIDTVKTVDQNSKELQNQMKATGVSIAEKASTAMKEVNKIVDKVKSSVVEQETNDNSESSTSDNKKKRFFKGI